MVLKDLKSLLKHLTDSCSSDILSKLICSFEGVINNMAQWLSWLERRPVTAEVEGSSPFWVVLYGILAQLGEHLPYKQRVTGSSPVGPI